MVPARFGRGGVVGGGERYALELARHMAKRVPTTLLTFGEPDDSMDGPLRVRTLGKVWHVRGQSSNPVAPGMFPELLRADVVHCHQHHLLGSTLAALFCRATGRRVFVSDLGGGGWDLSAYMSTDRLYHGHLHISEYSLRVARHEGSPRAHVILGGVDTERFAPATVPPSADAPALFVGRLLPHKGVDYLVEGVPPELPLEVIGEPYHLEFYERLRSLAAGKRVTFRHGLADEQLVRAYQGALCVVLPSVHHTSEGGHTLVPELLGQTLLEGMACGVPAICSDVASMPELVVDGVTGFVVPPNDPAALGARLQWLRDHPAEARAMGRAARQRVLERFTWEAVVERCLHWYADAV